MAEQMPKEKPFTDGILNKINGPPADTIRSFYEREVVGVRPSSKPRDWTKPPRTIEDEEAARILTEAESREMQRG